MDLEGPNLEFQVVQSVFQQVNAGEMHLLHLQLLPHSLFLLLAPLHATSPTDEQNEGMNWC